MGEKLQHEKVSRRRFLQMVSAVIATFLGHHLIDKNIRAAVGASVARVGETFSKLTNQEHEPSTAVLHKTWDKHFESKDPNFMSFDAWQRLAITFSKIVSIHFNAQHELDDFDEYFEGYIQKVEQYCAFTQLDMDIFFISMEYSARQIIVEPKIYRSDIAVGVAQNIGGAVSDYYDVSHSIADNIGVRALGLDVAFGGQFPLNYAAALRMLSANITTGIMDYELTEKAEQILLSLDENQLLTFSKEYPKLYEAFVELEKKRLLYESTRSELETSISANIDKLTPVMDIFFDIKTSDSAFEQIGLGNDPSSWQRTAATLLWQKLYYDRANNLTHDLLHEKTEAVKTEYRSMYDRNPVYARLKLLKEQIFNPEFMEFLYAKGISEEIYESLQTQLRKIAIKRDEYKHSLHIAQQREAAYELDPDYQLLTATIVTKSHLRMAEKIFKPFMKQTRDEVMFYAFVMSTIREASPPWAILSSFGRDFTCDAPYARDDVLIALQQYIQNVIATVGDPKFNISRIITEDLQTYGVPENIISQSRYWNWNSTVNWGNGIYHTGKRQFEE